MALKVTRMDVWAGEIPDQPGGLANMLTSLADAGANLESVIGRRQPDKPGTGVVFVAPVKGKKVQDAARAAGLATAEHTATVRVEGPDRPGVGSQIARAVADAGVNMRGISGAVVGRNFVAYLRFDNGDDAARALKAIKDMDKAATRKPAKRKMAMGRK